MRMWLQVMNVTTGSIDGGGDGRDFVQVEEGLVAGEGFAIDASVVKAELQHG